MRTITGANGNIGRVQEERTTNKKRKEILINYIYKTALITFYLLE